MDPDEASHSSLTVEDYQVNPSFIIRIKAPAAAASIRKHYLSPIKKYLEKGVEQKKEQLTIFELSLDKLLPRTPSRCCVNPGSKDMPRQNGAEMFNDRQTSVVIEVVKRSAMNKPQKRPG